MYQPTTGRFLSEDPLPHLADDQVFASTHAASSPLAPGESDFYGHERRVLGRKHPKDAVESGNLYAYVANDPVNKIDPSGLAPTELDRLLELRRNLIRTINAGGRPSIQRTRRFRLRRLQQRIRALRNPPAPTPGVPSIPVPVPEEPAFQIPGGQAGLDELSEAFFRALAAEIARVDAETASARETWWAEIRDRSTRYDESTYHRFVEIEERGRILRGAERSLRQRREFLLADESRRREYFEEWEKEQQRSLAQAERDRESAEREYSLKRELRALHERNQEARLKSKVQQAEEARVEAANKTIEELLESKYTQTQLEENPETKLFPSENFGWWEVLQYHPVYRYHPLLPCSVWYNSDSGYTDAVFLTEIPQTRINKDTGEPYELTEPLSRVALAQGSAFNTNFRAAAIVPGSMSELSAAQEVFLLREKIRTEFVYDLYREIPILGAGFSFADGKHFDAVVNLVSSAALGLQAASWLIVVKAGRGAIAAQKAYKTARLLNKIALVADAATIGADVVMAAVRFTKGQNTAGFISLFSAFAQSFFLWGAVKDIARLEELSEGLERAIREAADATALLDEGVESAGEAVVDSTARVATGRRRLADGDFQIGFSEFDLPSGRHTVRVVQTPTGELLIGICKNPCVDDILLHVETVLNDSDFLDAAPDELITDLQSLRADLQQKIDTHGRLASQSELDDIASDFNRQLRELSEKYGFADLSFAPRSGGYRDPGAIDDIADFRDLEGLPEFMLADASTGTVARIDSNGVSYYGRNSTLPGYRFSLAERRAWFSHMKANGRLRGLDNLGQAQFLSHAEADALIQAWNAGPLRRHVILYVDRPTCPNCQDYLGDLLGELGVERLDIYWRNATNPPRTIMAR